jgi:hypothetical protein
MPNPPLAPKITRIRVPANSTNWRGLKDRLIQLVREGREVRAEPIARAVRVDLATGTYETEAAA